MLALASLAVVPFIITKVRVVPPRHPTLPGTLEAPVLQEVRAQHRSVHVTLQTRRVVLDMVWLAGRGMNVAVVCKMDWNCDVSWQLHPHHGNCICVDVGQVEPVAALDEEEEEGIIENLVETPLLRLYNQYSASGSARGRFGSDRGFRE